MRIHSLEWHNDWLRSRGGPADAPKPHEAQPSNDAPAALAVHEQFDLIIGTDVIYEVSALQVIGSQFPRTEASFSTNFPLQPLCIKDPALNSELFSSAGFAGQCRAGAELLLTRDAPFKCL